MIASGYLAAGGLVALLAVGAWGLHQRGEAIAARGDLAAADLELSLARAAATERERQDDANEEARRIAAARVLTLEADHVRLLSELERIADEGDQDPRRDDCGLGADSVRRLGTIAGRAAAGRPAP